MPPIEVEDVKSICEAAAAAAIAAACAGPSEYPIPGPVPAGEGVNGRLRILDGCVDVTDEAGDDRWDCSPLAR